VDVVKRGLVVAVVIASLGAGAADAGPAMTKSKARKIARAVSLTADDVPGYVADTNESTPGEDLWGGKVYARCAGRKGLGKALVDVTTSFRRKGDEDFLDVVGSEIEVMPKARYVKQDLAIARTAHGRACLLKEIKHAADFSPDLKLISARVTRLTPPVSHGVGLHVALTVQPSGGDQIEFFADLLVIGDKNVEAAIIGDLSQQSPSRGDLDRLLNIVRTRLRAQLHPDDVIV
jgi:hypothetical protein